MTDVEVAPTSKRSSRKAYDPSLALGEPKIDCMDNNGWTTRFLMSVGVAMYSRLERAICLTCRTTREPKTIVSHLTDNHSSSIPKADRELVGRVLEKHRVGEAIALDGPLDQPVPHLPIFAGKECPLEACTYSIRTRKNWKKQMKKHWKHDHSRQHGDCPSLESLNDCNIQQLDHKSPYLRCPVPEEKDSLSSLASEWFTSLPDVEALATQVGNDRGWPPHLVREALPRFLGRFVTEKKSMLKLSEAMKLPRPTEKYDKLESVVDQFFLDVHTTAHSREFFIMKIFGGAEK